MSFEIERAAYADMYGPTAGDRVRLADTDLVIEVEQDRTTYGEEVKFGGGKVIRDGMGQSQRTRADGAVDTVITNALIVDPLLSRRHLDDADVATPARRRAALDEVTAADVQQFIALVFDLDDRIEVFRTAE